MEADVSELEVNHVQLGGEGVMAIKSRPDYVYRFRTTLMNPTASVKDQENTFAVRGEFVRATPPVVPPRHDWDSEDFRREAHALVDSLAPGHRLLAPETLVVRGQKSRKAAQKCG